MPRRRRNDPKPKPATKPPEPDQSKYKYIRPEVVLGTGTPPVRQLLTLDDLRQFMGNVINRLNQYKITQKQARALGYLCTALADIIRTSDLETRLAQLEEYIETNNLR